MVAMDCIRENSPGEIHLETFPMIFGRWIAPGRIHPGHRRQYRGSPRSFNIEIPVNPEICEPFKFHYECSICSPRGCGPFIGWQSFCCCHGVRPKPGTPFCNDQRARRVCNGLSLPLCPESSLQGMSRPSGIAEEGADGCT
jgi:hypothetical protein